MSADALAVANRLYELVRQIVGGVGKSWDELSEDDYLAARAAAMSHPALRDTVPNLVRLNRGFHELWDDLKVDGEKVSTTERRMIVKAQFEPMLSAAESRAWSPILDAQEFRIEELDSDGVWEAWRRLRDRGPHIDAAGTITAARSLVEATTKCVLDRLGETYPSDADPTRLVKLALAAIGAEDKSSVAVKKIVSGLGTCAQGLAELRNDSGDAHGKGEDHTAADERHAELAANAAVTTSVFLIASFADETEPPPTAVTGTPILRDEDIPF